MNLSQTQKTALTQLAQDYMGTKRTVKTRINKRTLIALYRMNLITSDFDTKTGNMTNVKLYKQGIQWACANVVGFLSFLENKETNEQEKQAIMTTNIDDIVQVVAFITEMSLSGMTSKQIQYAFEIKFGVKMTPAWISRIKRINQHIA